MVEEDLDISIDGEPVALMMLAQRAGGRRGAPQQVVPAKRTEAIFVPAGQHEVSAAFVNRIDGSYDDQFSPPMWSSAERVGGQYGVTGLTHLTELLITGPRNVSGVSETESRRKIFTCRPTSATEERPCAESILAELAAQAYRRPLTEEDVADLMNFYDQASAEDGFEVGVRMGLQAILMSPEFLFRLERMPAGVQPGQAYRMSDVDLATRLSFFLWASAPDEELIEVAASGRLSDPSVLEQQVERMLEDARSETLATRFAHQWLRLQDVGRVWPERFLYPDFSQQLAEAMVRETELLFQHLVQEDRSLLEFFDADYTFLNERLTMAEGLISRGLSEIGSAGGDFAMPFGIASSAEAMAYGLRAQIRFRKGDMAGAVSDAQQVPKEFIAWVTRDAGPFRRNKAYYDGTFIRYARLNGVNDWWEGDSNPVNGVPWPAVIPFTGFRNLGILPDGRAVREDGLPIRTDGQYRTPVEDTAVPDTRVQFVEGIIQGDANQTFINARYDSEDSDYPLVNWKEMWLIRAEGVGGQGAIDLVNELRAFDNLPLVTYADPGNAQQIRYMIVEERRRTLYVEGQFYFTKLRNLDLLWFPRAQGIIPVRGDLYGGGVRMHMPNDEFTLNENLTLDDRATGCAVNERPVRFQ